MTTGRRAHLHHLARRFVGALSSVEPRINDARWVLGVLLPSEHALFVRMSAADRRHAIDVARRVEGDATILGERPVLAAALLHDVGKVDAALGTFARAGATVVVGIVGRRRCIRGDGRLARYLRHPDIGADLCSAAGSDGLTVAWAREHHLRAGRWSVPHAIGVALKAADDD